MKLKGITPFERHAEKIALGVFALFLLAVVVMQAGLVGGARTVKVGSRDLPLDKALGAVSDAAVTRRARLEATAVAEGIPASLPSPMEKFLEVKANAVPTGLGTIAALGPAGLRGDRAGDGSATVLASSDAPFAEPVLPAPSVPLVNLNEGTIDPIEPLTHGESLAKLLPPQQPFDLRSFTIQTSFDAASLRESIVSPSADSGRQPLPTSFWQGRLELIDVEVWRQARGSDGQWTEAELLPPMPGRASLRALASKDGFQPGDFRSMLEQEGNTTTRQTIRRAGYYAMITGMDWTWPAQALKSDDQDSLSKLDVALRALKGVRADIEARERQLSGGQRRQTPRPNDPAPRNRPGGRQPPPGEAPPLPPPGGNDPDEEQNQDRDRTPQASRSPSPYSGIQEIPPPLGEDFVFPPIPTHWMAQLGGGGGGGGEEQGEDEAEKARKRQAEREKRQRDAVAKKLAELRERENTLVAELRALGYNDQGQRLEANAPFEEPLASLASDQSGQITLWSHDITAKPGMTYRYRARVAVSNPFYGRGDSLREEQRPLPEKPTLLSPESEWSAPVTLDESKVFFLSTATLAGGPLEGRARASADLFEFYYGYWRSADQVLQQGDAVAAELSLPELPLFELSKDDRGVFVVKNKSTLDRTRRVKIDGFLLDVALRPGSLRNETLAYFRMNRLGESRVVSMGSVAADPGTNYLRLQNSMRASQTAVIREPGQVGPATAPPPTERPAGTTPPPAGPTAPKPPPKAPDGIPSKPKF